MSIEYTNPDRIDAVDIRPLPHHLAGLQWTASGYGSKIPTRYRVRHLSMSGARRWRRVYAMCYSNVATLYILIGRRRLVLDLSTEHALERAREAA